MFRNLLRRFDQFRRRYTEGVNAWLYGLIGRDKFLLHERLDASDIRRILVLRNNKRIGNMYFLLPFLNAVKQTYPTAKVELMVIAPSQVKVFDAMSLNKIWVSHFAFTSAWQFFKTLRACRKQPYDLLFMPHPSSTDIIIGALIHARNKVTFADSRTLRVYPHAVRGESASPHAALTPLALLNESTAPVNVNHLMTFTLEEKRQAQREVKQLCGQTGLCIAYFRGARGKKIITDESWHTIRRKFDAAANEPITWIEILSPDVTTPLISGTSTWQSSNFRHLGAFIAACDLFICGDTGPLHLADAAGARCIGLFTATSPMHYGCLGKQCVNLTNIESLNAQEVLASIMINRSTSDRTP